MNIQNALSRSEHDLPESNTEQTANVSSLDLSNLRKLIRVRWKLIVGSTLVVVALAVALIALATPIYSATSVVMLDQRKNNVESADAVLSGLGTDPATIQNQVQILTSVELANRVVDKLRLADDVEFNPPPSWTHYFAYLNPLNWFPAAKNVRATDEGLDLERSQLLHNFLNHLSVDPVGLSTAINITFKSTDPGKAQRIANAVADAYVEDQLEAKFQATQKATQWLSGRIGELSRKAQEAEAAVQRYKAEHNLTTTNNGASVVGQQTSDITSQLVIAKTELAEKQAAYSSLVSLAHSGRAADSAAAMASPVIAALRSQESEIARQLADMSSKYLPGHPKILDLQAQKQNIDDKINQEVQRIVDAARNDVTVASAHVGSLEGSLRQLENQGNAQNQASVGLTALESSATSARAMYEAFLGRLNQTQGQEGIQTPDARVISAAEMPQGPSFPKKELTLGLALPAGLLLGLLLAIALERLDTGFRTTQQIEDFLGYPVLGTVPEISGDLDPSIQIVDKPMSQFAEATRSVELGLTLSNLDKKPKVIVVTSSVPGEGKTTIAISLARLAARAGLKTLIIDGDLRRPSLSKRFGIDTVEHGWLDALSNQATLQQCLIADSKSEAKILAGLKTPVSPADVLASESMRQFLKRLADQFEVIIIDSAPLLPVNDTKILGRLADAVLFVVRWEKTPREAASNALRSLKDVHAPIAGIALARADTTRFSYYNYGYQDYRSYKKYYAT